MEEKLVFNTLTSNDEIENVVEYLEECYEEEVEYILHIERGDDLPTAITLKTLEVQFDSILRERLEDISYNL